MSDVPEAPLEHDEGGLVPKGEGWFVLNAREARWLHSEKLGSYCGFEGEPEFPEVGVNLNVLAPGQPLGMYHGEDAQEDFMVLHGEALLLIEGEERRLRQWDLVHCPPWTEHIIVGAGTGLCVVLGVGGRTRPVDLIYPAEPFAKAHDAAAEVTTKVGREAYARFARPVRGPYREGHLPD